MVEQDEREETGLRAVLNYGHTFAHAFETRRRLRRAAARRGGGGRHAVRGTAGGGDWAASTQAVVERQEALLEALELTLDPPDVDRDRT